VLTKREDVAVAMTPEVPVIEPVRVEFGVLSIGDAVEIEQPTILRRVQHIPRIMLDDGACTARLKPGQSKKGKLFVVQCGLSDNRVVRGTRLHADEPVTWQAIQVASEDRADVVFGLQRLAAAEEVVVVVLDQTS